MKKFPSDFNMCDSNAQCQCGFEIEKESYEIRRTLYFYRKKVKIIGNVQIV